MDSKPTELPLEDPAVSLSLQYADGALVRLKKRIGDWNKPKRHPFFKKLRARQDSRTRTMGDNVRCEEGKWNYERARAQRGTVVVGVSPAPAAWSRPMEGQRLRCVKVFYDGDEFYLDDSTGWGTEKVFKRGGGPDSPHRTIHVDDPSTFVQDPA